MDAKTADGPAAPGAVGFNNSPQTLSGLVIDFSSIGTIEAASADITVPPPSTRTSRKFVDVKHTPPIQPPQTQVPISIAPPVVHTQQPQISLQVPQPQAVLTQPQFALPQQLQQLPYQFYPPAVAPLQVSQPRPPSVRRPPTTRSATLFSTVREYELAFYVLRNDNPNVDIPAIRETDAITLVDELFKSTRRRIRRGNIILAVRLGVVAVCFIIDYLGTKALGIDGSEFTMSQVKNLHMYEAMIDEFIKQYKLDEEVAASESVEVAPWPIEIRFTVTVFMNFAIFYAGKIITQHGDIISLIAKIAGGTGATDSGPSLADSPMGALRGLFGGLGNLIQPLIGFVTGMQ